MKRTTCAGIPWASSWPWPYPWKKKASRPATPRPRSWARPSTRPPASCWTTTSPRRKVGEIDNRGSHFYLALYWAQALAAQNEDAGLKAHFAPLAKTLTEQEAAIIAELNGAQGKAVDIGGYYRSNPEKTSQVMRPSTTFNAAIDSLN